MKLKKLLFLVVAAVSATSAFAQKGIEDNSKYGHGEDSLNCLRNISVYTQYVKTKNYVDAYLPWKAVLEECPLSGVNVYINGVKLLTSLLSSEKNPQKYETLFNDLMKLYDYRMKYFGTLKSRPAVALLGEKAYYYQTYCPDAKRDVKQEYSWFSESVKARKEKSEYLMYFVKSSLDMLKADANFREQFINDYLFASECIDKAIATSKGAMLEYNQTAKNNINAYFVNSGVADCDNLQRIYAPQVEQNKNNLEHLRGILRVMELVGCTESEAYFSASLYSHQIEPTPESALGCAAMSVKKGDFSAAVKFYDEALTLEQDDIKKADIAYKAGLVLYADGKYSQARNYGRKALEYNKSYGKAYILIANAYAAAPRWSEEASLNACTYCLVVDKLVQARNVDPSVSDEVSELIGKYSAHYPAAKDLFMLGYSAGQSITIGGWIGETTTIRCK